MPHPERTVDVGHDLNRLPEHGRRADARPELALFNIPGIRRVGRWAVFLGSGVYRASRSLPNGRRDALKG